MSQKKYPGERDAYQKLQDLILKNGSGGPKQVKITVSCFCCCSTPWIGSVMIIPRLGLFNSKSASIEDHMM